VCVYLLSLFEVWWVLNQKTPDMSNELFLNTVYVSVPGKAENHFNGHNLLEEKMNVKISAYCYKNNLWSQSKVTRNRELSHL
jgi:hypothetical protein